MSDLEDRAEAARPLCPTCGVPMWLLKIDYVPGLPPANLLHFKCEACGRKEQIRLEGQQAQPGAQLDVNEENGTPE